MHLYKMAKHYLIVLTALLLLFPLPAMGLTTVTAPVTGTKTLSDDYYINITTGEEGVSAVHAGSGERIGVEPDKTVSVDISSTAAGSSANDVRGILADGGEVNFEKTGVYISAGDHQDAYGLYAENGGQITVGNGSEINITGSNYLYGIYAVSGWEADDADTLISTGNNTSITVGPADDYAIGGGVLVRNYTESTAVEVVLGDSNRITTVGDWSYGIHVNNDSGGGGEAAFSAGSGLRITTEGFASHGVVIERGAVNIGYGLNIETFGERSSGFSAHYSDTVVQVGNSARISTDQYGSYGVYANRGASVDIGTDLHVYTEGESSHGIYALNQYQDETDSDTYIGTGSGAVITTTGDRAHAVYANTYIRIESLRAAFDLPPELPYGLPQRSIIEVGDGANINASGSEASAVRADYFNSFITVGAGSAITAAGENAHGVLSVNGATVNLLGGTVSVDAQAAAAIAARYDFDEWSDPFSNYFISGDSTVRGEGVFHVYGDIAAEFSDRNGTWNEESLYGDGNGSALVDVTFEDGSLFYGATTLTENREEIPIGPEIDGWSEGGSLPGAFINLTMNGADTLWKVTGDSQLTNLRLNGAVIDYRNSNSGEYISIRTENFGGDTGGLLRMKTDLLAGLADTLLVSGTTGGVHKIDVHDPNRDGAAGATGEEELVLIETADQEGDFSLIYGKVFIGGYNFILSQDKNVSNSVNGDETGANWLLRASGASDPGTDGANVFSAAYLLSYAETETLMKRLGDLRSSPYSGGLWFRVHGGKFESAAKSYVKGFDMDYGGVHVGYDHKLENLGWEGDAYAGIMFGYSKGDLDYTSHGSGTVDSKMLGLYSTFTTPGGFFLDLILKYQWMDNDFDSFEADGSRVKGGGVSTGGFGFSFEAGQRIPFHGGQKGGWYAEPQVQLSYMRQDGGSFLASNGLNIGVDGFTSLIGRVGLLLGYETEKTNFYAKVSRAREFEGDVTVMANGTAIKEDFGGSFWVYGLGYTAKLNDRNSIYLDVERTSGWTFRQEWSARLGWRTEF